MFVSNAFSLNIHRLTRLTWRCWGVAIAVPSREGTARSTARTQCTWPSSRSSSFWLDHISIFLHLFSLFLFGIVIITVLFWIIFVLLLNRISFSLHSRILCSNFKCRFCCEVATFNCGGGLAHYCDPVSWIGVRTGVRVGVGDLDSSRRNGSSNSTRLRYKRNLLCIRTAELWDSIWNCRLF